jgi:hypothetical protein
LAAGGLALAAANNEQSEEKPGDDPEDRLQYGTVHVFDLLFLFVQWFEKSQRFPPAPVRRCVLAGEPPKIRLCVALRAAPVRLVAGLALFTALHVKDERPEGENPHDGLRNGVLIHSVSNAPFESDCVLFPEILHHGEEVAEDLK